MWVLSSPTSLILWCEFCRRDELSCSVSRTEQSYVESVTFRFTLQTNTHRSIIAFFSQGSSSLLPLQFTHLLSLLRLLIPSLSLWSTSSSLFQFPHLFQIPFQFPRFQLLLLLLQFPRSQLVLKVVQVWYQMMGLDQWVAYQSIWLRRFRVGTLRTFLIFRLTIPLVSVRFALIWSVSIPLLVLVKFCWNHQSWVFIILVYMDLTWLIDLQADNEALPFFDDDIQSNLSSFSSENLGIWVPQAPNPSLQHSQMGFKETTKEAATNMNMTKANYNSNYISMWNVDDSFTVPQISPPSVGSKRFRPFWYNFLTSNNPVLRSFRMLISVILCQLSFGFFPTFCTEACFIKPDEVQLALLVLVIVNIKEFLQLASAFQLSFN